MVGTQITETHATEVFYLVARFEGIDDTPTDASLREADRDIRALERQGLELEAADWRLAAEVKADGNISLADAYLLRSPTNVTRHSSQGGTMILTSYPSELIYRFRDHGV